ncbi:acyl carrier protein [Lachnospiraceae bacterium 42-17]
MNNLKKYNEIFMKVFSVEEKALEELEYQSIDEWDSVGHMELIAELEDGFDIMMDTDDIIDFSSYKKGIELLKKYEVEV